MALKANRSRAAKATRKTAGKLTPGEKALAEAIRVEAETRTTGKMSVPASGKILRETANRALEEIAQPLLALQDLGEHMNEAPFIGWTMRECVLCLTEKIRAGAALMPTPTDAKTLELVRRLLREGQAALDGLEESIALLHEDFDAGMKHGDGAAIIGAGVGSLAVRAGTAFETAAGAMGADAVMFCFFQPPAKAEERAIEQTAQK